MTPQDMTAANPIVICGGDEAFAMPLAAMIASAIDNLGTGRRLSIFVMDGGLTDLSVKKLKSLEQPGMATVEVLKPNLAVLKRLPVSGHVNYCAYLRLLMPHALPKTVQRAIYLDADSLVVSDLGELWDQSFDGFHCLAARDVAAPVLDARLGLAAYSRCAPYLATVRPISNYRDLGLRPSAKYFNSGVMLVDLAKWKRDDVARQLLECLKRNHRHVRWWDQYALNVVLADKWGELDPRWNQTSQIFDFPSWQDSPLDRETFEQLQCNPFIVHFNSRKKPWHADCPHPWRDRFWHYVAMTPWSDAGPVSPTRSFRRLRRERFEDLLVFAGRRYRWLSARFC